MSRSHSKLLVWLICITLVVMRVGAVHVHFCADGNEPAASVHVGDAGIDDLDHPRGIGVDSALSDSDMSVPADVLVKKFDNSGVDLPTMALAFALVLFLVVCVQSVPVDWGPLFVRISDPTQLRPPLRGPPA
ncbi:MAG: hypothetical protein JSR66_18265 [Proteobacteria bacterium]|nr:hypothetical protein [Pseudomonadota bacterium]